LAAGLGALNSQSLQMAERALLSPDELKNLPKGDFIVMKTGTHPMRTKLQLYFKWGISFEEPYQVPERAQREVYYAGGAADEYQEKPIFPTKAGLNAESG
jgi:type IV secretion system protein VirD4